MLQRIQTIWTLLAVLAAVFLFITGQDVVISDSLPLLTISCIVLVIMIRVNISSYHEELVRSYYHDNNVIKCTETRSLA